MAKTTKSKPGFTLVETLVSMAVSIIFLVSATVLVVNYSKIYKQSLNDSRSVFIVETLQDFVYSNVKNKDDDFILTDSHEIYFYNGETKESQYVMKDDNAFIISFAKREETATDNSVFDLTYTFNSKPYLLSFLVSL